MTSRKTQAHRAGIVYVMLSALGFPVLIYAPSFIVAGDAAATAHKIASGVQLYRLILLSDLAAAIFFLVLGWMLYHLFEAVDRKLALLMILLVLASACVSVIDVALLGSPLVFLSDATFASAFAQPQLDALALAFLKVRGLELQANVAFWGLWLIPFGMLVIKSNFIPKLIGILLFVASVGYVAMSVAFFVFPAQRHDVGQVGMLLTLGELPVILWLLIMGARENGLEKQA